MVASSTSSRTIILTDLAGAERLVAAEADIVAHLNADHAEAVRLHAHKLLGGADGAWRCVRCDPQKLESQLDRTALRLPFPQRIMEPESLRKLLRELAEAARKANWHVLRFTF